jgi:hypothetical protein
VHEITEQTATWRQETPGAAPGVAGGIPGAGPPPATPAGSSSSPPRSDSGSAGPGYRRQDTSDPIAHWMNHDCCRPHTTFPPTRGCRLRCPEPSPAHLAATSRQASIGTKHSTLRSARPRCPPGPATAQPRRIMSADPPGQLRTAWPTPEIAT